MVWTKKAKLDFYWNRRRKAVSTYTNAAILLGTSTKRAKQRAIKEVSKEYKIRKQNYKDINKLEKQINKIKKVEIKTRTQEKQIEKLMKQQAKLIVKTTNRWNVFEEKIQYKSKGAQDEEIITKPGT